MKMNLCPQEERVLQACSTGEWPEPLRTHAATCPECAEMVRTYQWMQEQAYQDIPHNLPDPGMIWWKAQLMQREILEQKAIRPVQTFQRASVVVTLLAVFLIGLWRWPHLEKWLGAWTPGLERSWWTLTNLSPVFTTLMLISVGLIAVSVVLTFFAVLSED
ncbi:MAG: hypothetical protein PHX83_17355 [Acidobacteriia bacterium]|nr:hypothetical protein [Terriglobia bacterium]